MRQKRPVRPALLIWTSSLACLAGGGLAGAAPVASSAGDVIFSELMIAPDPATREWIELYNRTDATIALEGCTLVKRDLESNEDCSMIDPNEATADAAVYTFETGARIDPGQYFVAHRGNYPQLYEDDSCPVESDVVSTGIGLGNSGDEVVYLNCAGLIVDCIAYNWEDFSSSVIDKYPDGSNVGQSIMRHPTRMDETDDHTTAQWCLASDDLLDPCITEAATGEGELNDYELATAGAPNECPTIVPPPPAGAAYINEIATWPDAQWIEIRFADDNDETYSLDNCTLISANCSSAELVDDSVETCMALDLGDVGTKSTAITASDGGTLDGTPGALISLVKSTSETCLEVDEDGACLTEADGSFSTISLYASDTGLLELQCLGADGEMYRVDRTAYRGREIDDTCTQPEGRCSWALDPDEGDAASNDSESEWAAAGSKASYYADIGESTPDVAYGTPGRDNLTGPLVPIQPGDIIFQELPTWPTSSTESGDWIELGVPGSPAEGDTFAFSECKIRTERCPDDDYAACLEETLADDSWDTTSALIPLAGDAIEATTGDVILLVSDEDKACIAYASDGSCAVYADGYYSSTIGPSSSDTRLLEIACPDEHGRLAEVDRIVFNADWFAPTCRHEEGRCSWELRPSASDGDPATRNDDPLEWTTSRSTYQEAGGDLVYGTPGLNADDPTIDEAIPARVETLGRPAPGDVAIAELQVASSSTPPEWVEIRGVGTGPFELAGCALVQVKDDGEKEYHFLDTVHLPIDADENVLLAYSAPCVTFTAEGMCAHPTDYQYKTLNFSSSEAQSLELRCPGDDGSGQVIDAFDYDWPSVEDQCSAAHCSIEVHPDHLNATDNDDPFYRCVAPAGEDESGNPWPTYLNVEDEEDAGSPGDDNRCPALPDVPAEGELVITELMIKPRSPAEAGFEAHEYFEIYNAADRTLDLPTCTFFVGEPLDDTDPSAETGPIPGLSDSVSIFTLASEKRSIAPGDYQVWAKDGCIYSTNGSCDEDDGGAFRLAADASYDGLSFTNEGLRVFGIQCFGPGNAIIDVDRVEFDGSWVDEGHAWQLAAGVRDASANDDRNNWCEATLNEQIQPNDKVCNYGTPGEANMCEGIPPFEGAGAACRCDARGPSRPDLSSPAMLVAGLGLLALRRRRFVRRKG